MQMNQSTYSLVTAYLREGARWKHHPLADEIVRKVCEMHLGARAAVYRASEGCFGSGEVATPRILVLSTDLPVKVEILVTEAEANRVLSLLDEMISDGLVTVSTIQVAFDRTSG